MPSIDQRRLPDRRRRPTPLLAAFFSPGRRRGFRRAGEGINSYVDRPGLGMIVSSVVVVLLSALDAALTLLHVRAGGGELTPTMALALIHGETTFTVCKMGVTALGVMFLTLHEYFPVARFGFRFVLTVYSLLMAYHVILISLR